MKFKFIIIILVISLGISRIPYASIDFNHPKNTSPIMIFVSFSMPKESLKGWIEEGRRIHAPVIIRGLVNNSFKETITTIGVLTENNKGGVQLNPMLFEQFHIEKVPAVVVALANDCLSNQTCQMQYDTIYGDTTLEYALKKIANENDSLSVIANNALEHLREKK